jgi:hypothetical protein
VAERPAGQGHIQFFGFQRAGQGRLFDGFLLFGKSLFQAHFHLVGTLPGIRAFFFGKGWQAAEELHHRGTAAQVGHPPGFQAGLILNRGQCGQRPLPGSAPVVSPDRLALTYVLR